MAAEKQIAAARADEVVMAAIHADPQILEEHLTVEATVDASRANCGTPAQSNRFTMHCQQRPCLLATHNILVQKTTALLMLAEQSLYYNSCRGQAAHPVRLNNMYII